MAITAYSTTRVGRMTVVTVTSDLAGTIYYHWYVDGSWVGSSSVAYWMFTLETSDQVEIVCQDTTDAEYDPVANAPAGWPATKTLFWVASADTDVDHYLVEQQKDAEGWVELGTIEDDGSWWYTLRTPRLTDLASYQWRITPYDRTGNAGTATTIGPETCVRRPDAPDFAVAYSGATERVTFSEA